MTPYISETQFERHIEAVLLRGGPAGGPADRVAEAVPSCGEGYPGGNHRRSPEEYDGEPIPQDLVDFAQATPR